jgi:hypothetical protein
MLPKKTKKINSNLYCFSPSAILDSIVKDDTDKKKSLTEFWQSHVTRAEAVGVPSGAHAARPQVRKSANIQANPLNSLCASANFTQLSITQEGFKNCVDLDTGEFKQFQIVNSGKFKPVCDSDNYKNKLFSLQDTASKLLPRSRVSKCLKLLKSKSDGVSILKSLDHGTCSFSGLQTCGSVWDCPVCAAKISSKRTLEISEAITQHKLIGDCILVTYTIPHTNQDDLKDLLLRLSQSMSSMKAHRSYKDCKKGFHQIGTIRKLEITHGVNGWHPHIHELWFTGRGVDLPLLKDLLYKSWSSACLKNDLGAISERFGVDVTPVNDTDTASLYMAKELTMNHTKLVTTNNRYIKGRTPYDFLTDYDNGDKQSGILFQEYSKAFHGQRQLYWSRGLKKLYSIINKSDELLASEHIENSIRVGFIDYGIWRNLLKKSRQMPHLYIRSTILNLSKSDYSLAQSFIDSVLSGTLDRFSSS